MKHIDTIAQKAILKIGFLFLLLTPLLCFTQTQSDTIPRPSIKIFPTWEAGAFFGLGLIYGDLTSDIDVITGSSQPAYGIWAVRNFNPNWSARINLFHTKLKANDLDSKLAGHRARGFSHETPLTEISLLAQWDLRGKRRYQQIANFKKTVSPYFFAGLAGGIGKPDVFYDDKEGTPTVLEDEENTTNFRLAIPFGGGLKIDLSQRSFVGFEFGLRPTFNDLLDGVSESGNAAKDDWYAFGGMTIGYRFATDDADGDGVVDVKDKCPGVAGEKRFRGCPDTDGDGVRDSDDKCPLIAGAKTMNGCPDSDLDGVEDAEDECPNTKGMLRLQGCPDADWDNVIDKNDVCPNTPGLAEFKGCPDTDLDGVMDSEDKCPEVAGKIEFQGCPEEKIVEEVVVEEFVKETPVVSSPDLKDETVVTESVKVKESVIDELKNSVLEMPKVTESSEEIVENTNTTVNKKVNLPVFNSIRFATGSNVLSNRDKQTLDEAAARIAQFPNFKLLVFGYTDNVGNDALNQKLSKQRAIVCFNYLMKKGVNPTQMSYAGFGEFNPIAPNNTAAGRAKNRRVEIIFERKVN